MAERLSRQLDYTRHHVVVVDDASRDNSSVFFPQENVWRLTDATPGGVAYAANWGVTRCPRSTEFVSFLDGDDWIDTDYADVLAHSLRTHNADVAMSKYEIANDPSIRLPSGEVAFWERFGSQNVHQVSPDNIQSFFMANALPGRRMHRIHTLPQFTEGCAHFEDNPMWWRTLVKYPRVALVPRVLYFHRTSRSLSIGVETSEMLWHSFALYYKHMNDHTLQPTLRAWQRSLSWIPTRQADPRSTRILQEQIQWIVPRYALTVVIPCYNIAKWVADLCRCCASLITRANKWGFSVQILFVDAGTTDNSIAYIKQFTRRRQHTQLLTYPRKSAFPGRARNFAIPFVQGNYCLFFDGDDVLEPAAWVNALRVAYRDDADLVFVKYERLVEHVDKNDTTWVSEPMFTSDRVIWEKTNKGRVQVAEFINYPWTRIVRTRLIYEQAIHFGIEASHNDILFHWLSVAHSSTIRFVDSVGTRHRHHYGKMQTTTRALQRTSSIHRDIRLVHRRIVDAPSWLELKQTLIAFTHHIFDWIRHRFGDHIHTEVRFTLDCIRSDERHACVRYISRDRKAVGAVEL